MKFSLIKFKPKTKQVKGLECLNCEMPLNGSENFCSYCGQKNATNKLSFGNFLNSLFSGFLSYDSRFWRTFIPLLTKPGKVSKDFIEGKRARFVNPFQLYLNVSIVFFLVLGISNKIDSNTINKEIAKTTKSLDSLSEVNKKQLDSIISDAKTKELDQLPKDSAKAKVISTLGTVINLNETKNEKRKKDYIYNINSDTVKKINMFNRMNDFYHFHKKNPKLSSLQILDSLGYKKTFWNKFYIQQVLNMEKNYKTIKEDGGRTYFKKLTSYISVSLFIFLPVFTLFLRLIYIRRKFTYMEHLVFVFNTQTVFFLLLTIFYLCNLFVNMDNIGWVFTLLFLFYLYKAMRYFYEQERAKTLIKLTLLNSYYLFLGMIGFIIVAVISFTFG